MKWYFASNEQSETLIPLIKAAVLSAKANTSLEPHFIYDGKPDSLTEWLEQQGVKIIYHRVSFYDVLEKYYNKNDLHIPAGAYLRCEIPMLNTDDEYVLYTDCDVMFLKDITSDNTPKPKFFSCSSEFTKWDFVNFNTGVMIMNLPSLRATYNEFTTFIRDNLPKLNVYDQTAYQLFYANKNTPLNIKFNHKPYWGIDKKAAIVHFHGPKPYEFVDKRTITNNPRLQILLTLLLRNPDGYRQYLSLYAQYSAETPYNKDIIDYLLTTDFGINVTPKSPFIKRAKNFARKRLANFKNIIKRFNI